GDGGAPVATAVCGSSLLMGASTAPSGAVTVSPGASTIQAALSSHAAGTTYYLTAGTYSISGSIDPQDGDTFIGAPGAIIDGSNSQPVAFGLNDHATNVTIKYLTIQHFAGPQNNGIVNQGQGANWTVEYNTIQNNPDAMGGANGIEIGDGDVVRYNCLTGNGQTGISADGAKNFTVDHNEVAMNAVGYEAMHNCGCSGGMKFFTSTGATITNNWIHDNGSVGLWVDTNNSFYLIDGNVIENSEDEAIMYEISYNAVIRNNLLHNNGIAGNASSADFPEPAIYVSESGGYDAGAAVVMGGVDVNGVLLITGNTFLDNADGVVLYQNATRCCGTKDGCSSCGGTTPLYSQVDSDGNQRWNTQNVTVSSNTFTYDANGKCTADSSKSQYCTVQAMFSTSQAIDQDIAFHQNNVFKDNTYAGPWMFLTPDQGSPLIAPSAWQAAPYAQDVGSAFH
ncbi:MAG TPA: right-handed parallel beta-helix repeat-containing protein, partial [Polyangiaceae bacterium]|nr:right-handed parallel beta-helix repeat-containing protein [Polyangiaceae bacterium]